MKPQKKLPLGTSNNKSITKKNINAKEKVSINVRSLYPKHDEALVKSVHKVLNLVINEPAKRAILFCLDYIYSIRIIDIPKKPEVFDEGLKAILGSGAIVLETEILKQFYTQMGLEFTERDNWTFSDHINYVKNDQSKSTTINKLESSKSSKRIHKVLCNLGLSDYEARAYVFLVMEGSSTVRTLSLKCGVPRTKAYATLKKLVERSLVYELPEEPRTFVATSPAKAFDQYLSNLREKTSYQLVSLVESREFVSLLEEDYKKMKQAIKPLKEEVWIIKGWSEIIRKIKGMLSQAKKSVIVITTEDGFSLLYKNVSKLLDKAIENGVIVQIGTPRSGHNGFLIDQLSHICKVEDINVDSPLLYLRVDDQTFLLVKMNPNNVKLESEKSVGVFCNSPILCHLFSILLPKHKTFNTNNLE